jgi:SSS family solute:Na+ symporter
MSGFSFLDGSIVGVYLLGTMLAGIAVRRYVRRVDDFLVAGREMDLYLGIASLAATEFGIVTCMYTAQAGYQFGFSGATPGIANAIAMLIVGYTGIGIKPLRDAGVRTIPELFDQRFGPRVRWASGVVIVLGGLLNMGVFLRVGGEFLMIVSGVDAKYLTITMTVLLAAVAIYTILGGMLSVLITDFLQFVVMSIGLIAVTILILWTIGWDALTNAVETRIGPGGFNPFVHAELGAPYVVFNFLLQFAVVLTWQTTVARVLAARDSRTGQKVYTRTAFFFVCRFLIPGLWGIAALATLAPNVVAGDTLHAMPTLLRNILPAGLLGLVIAAMLAADMSTDSSYMLTWAGIIYNDILAPFRRGTRSERSGLFVNRMIVAVIGLFLLVYGLWYPLRGDLWTYLGVTGTIYLSSMSALLLACCYWRRANDWGAMAAIGAGAIIPVGFLVMQQLPSTTALAAKIGPYYSGIAAYVATSVAMVVGSLLKPR